MSDVRVAVAGDAGALAATLAEAFGDDPVWCWMVPPKGRHGRLERIFGALLRYAIPRGHVYTTADRQAVTMWAPPREWRLPTSAVARAALPLLRATGSRLPRLLGRMGEIDRLHERQPADHWYLEFIGTTDAARGTGLGSLLLDDALTRFDEAGLPVYLESSNERNLSFYRRHGFTVTGEPPMRSGPPQWTLWRDPRPAR
ncbi:GNAT family N-acetyltransferase [Catellatospora bangladeshensis]|uniref:GCN5 family N-acetyltransferase n=1 Tax=Catellatospora bangladeshensis TaxID=310355 RepID=A0A8J3NMN8_9ACTN|nr:GNAT family N-acetyltransferase [Catellatospora bangladeshensis]GIF83975.1 GCN5 family N-acetyltransferase [Catellatospora bangladeshensis]